MEMFDAATPRTKTDPIPTAKTTRMQDVRGLTSLPAGRVVPIVAIPLLRMDAVRRASIRFSFEMMETVEVLMNAVNVDVKAYLVSNLALDRFDGMDALNRSYSGIAVEGLPVVPFCEYATMEAPGTNLIHKYLGLHYKTGDWMNTLYDEAYNQVWNMRARNRSPDLALRTRLQNDLAPAFWKHQQWKNVVGSVDLALIDGEVPVNVAPQALPVKGIGFNELTAGPLSSNVLVRETATWPNNTWAKSMVATTANTLHARVQDAATVANAFPQIYAEMVSNGITVSLSNIEMARKTQAFAVLKESYQGITDDYIIDLLMQGIEVPEQALSQPILLGQASTIFGMSKRYATDSGALTDSVVNGATFLDLTFRTPVVSTGGCVIVTAEILPEQLFERQRDPMHGITDHNYFPDYLRDTLDPEKVDIIKNSEVDAAHADPSGTFGYVPLNHRWMMQPTRIGGRFYRPDPASTTNDEDRQRIWAVETINPSLAADFYISTNINTKPFVVTNQDPFECVSRGMVLIEGNTVFGGHLVESHGSYEEVLGEAPVGKIPQAPGGITP